MRILVEPSDYDYLNVGDAAMMQVAATKLGVLWPRASIQIFSDTPDLLPAYSPNAQPLITTGRHTWLRSGLLSGRLCQYMSGEVSTRVLKMERLLRRSWPTLMELSLLFKLRLKGKDGKDLRAFIEAIEKSDLVLVTGMGGITDAFLDYALDLLEILEMAMHHGALTAMVGQGIGPIQDPVLLERAKAVLPHVNFISLREGRASVPLLHSLGVISDRIMVTGDDAIQLAYRLRTEVLGNGLGVNLRTATYSEVDQQCVQRIRPIVQDAARKYKAPLIPVPISRKPEEADADTIEQLTTGYSDVYGDTSPSTPLQVIQQIRCCRVVVTGSYHAAVFALSLGVPAVCMANSAYYADKFLGLADQFGAGCEVVFLHDNELPETLVNAIERAWRSAEQVKPELLSMAARQVQLSDIAYRRIYDLVLSHR